MDMSGGREELKAKGDAGRRQQSGYASPGPNAGIRRARNEHFQTTSAILSDCRWHRPNGPTVRRAIRGYVAYWDIDRPFRFNYCAF